MIELGLSRILVISFLSLGMMVLVPYLILSSTIETDNKKIIMDIWISIPFILTTIFEYIFRKYERID